MDKNDGAEAGSKIKILLVDRRTRGVCTTNGSNSTKDLKLCEGGQKTS